MRRIKYPLAACILCTLANAALADTVFITGQTLGTLRNNFTGNAGFRFAVNTPITITQLGRWVVSGNSGTHKLAIYNSGCVELGSVSVNTSGATAAAYLYATLSLPITLGSGTYDFFSVEANGGDQWYDSNTTVTSTAVASVTLASYDICNSTGSPGAGHTHGPYNFQYTLGIAARPMMLKGGPGW